MSTDRNTLWLKYVNTCSMGGTPEQRRWAFDAWWKPEKADAMASKRAEQKASKRQQAKALR
jgi:hypothetical protein